jgi:hypothetical protein
MLFGNPRRHRRYVRRSWLELMRRHGAGRPLALLEIGAGASAILPKALAKYNRKSRYVTINENRELTREFRRNTRRLPIQIEVIEGDAADIKEHLPPGSVDILAFEHSMNDILQAILLERDGIDTARGDWFELLPIVRPWLAALTGGREVTFEGFDAQWWFFWEKC